MKIRIGQEVIVRGIRCCVVAIHRAGTVDVEEIGGARAWRVSGLALA